MTSYATPDPAAESVTTAATVAHLPRVLIIEDTVELGEIIKAALRNSNVMTFHETSGATALETYHALHPEIVFLDIGLPDMTGWRVLDTIKATQSDLDHPSVVVITAYGDAANRLMGKLQGVYSYLIKPFSLDQIRQVVAEILASRSSSAA